MAKQNPVATGTRGRDRRAQRATVRAYSSTVTPAGRLFHAKCPSASTSSGTDWYVAAFDSGPTMPMRSSDAAQRCSRVAQPCETTVSLLSRMLSSASDRRSPRFAAHV